MGDRKTGSVVDKNDVVAMNAIWYVPFTYCISFRGECLCSCAYIEGLIVDAVAVFPRLSRRVRVFPALRLMYVGRREAIKAEMKHFSLSEVWVYCLMQCGRTRQRCDLYCYATGVVTSVR